jgi:hypothetical protein
MVRNAHLHTLAPQLEVANSHNIVGWAFDRFEGSAFSTFSLAALGHPAACRAAARMRMPPARQQQPATVACQLLAPPCGRSATWRECRDQSGQEPIVAMAAAQPEVEGNLGGGGSDSDEGLSAHELLLKQFPPMEDLRAAIEDVTAPLAMRMRAVYYLRTVASEAAIDILGAGLLDRQNTPLMRHELAYVLGQIRKPQACAALEAVLADEGENAMVRHESAEALGAIGEARSIELLRRCAREPVLEVAETCKIACDFVEWKQRQAAATAAAGSTGGDGGGVRGNERAPMVCACMNPYNSHDPAPADPEFDGWSVAEVCLRGHADILALPSWHYTCTHTCTCSPADV